MTKPCRRVHLACALAALGALGWGPPVQSAQDTLRMVAHADLKVLDPTFTTAYVTRNMGHLVYDTLLAQDRKGNVHPQMLEKYSAAPNGLTWSFTLRPGLKFSDGHPVTSHDVLASIARWMDKDSTGQRMKAAGAEFTVVDARNFSLVLKEPLGVLLEALSRPSSYPLFILPERLAKLPNTEPLTEVLGSGPFIFKRDEWQPGNKAVFVRNPHYLPRTEAADGLAGNKQGKFSRVEWWYMPDAKQSIAALKRGEVDYIDQVAPDYITPLRQESDIQIIRGGTYQAVITLNHLQPPLGNAQIRRAIQMAVQQDKIITAMGYPADMWSGVCTSYFVCGSTHATDAGASDFRRPRIARARQLLNEGGYQGEKVVMLTATDVVYQMAGSLATAQMLRSIGMNVEIQNSDWVSLTKRRAKREPLSEGGWSIYYTVAGEFDAHTPVAYLLGAACGDNQPGWPCDRALDQLRSQWVQASGAAARKTALDAFHTRAYEVVPYALAGQYATAGAARKALKGVENLWAGLPNVWVLDK